MLCKWCRREILPSRLRSPGGKDTNRSPSKGMIAPVDKDAERIKRRKAAKDAAQIREALASRDFGTIKLILTGLRPPVEEIATEECPDCLEKLKGRLNTAHTVTKPAHAAR